MIYKKRFFTKVTYLFLTILYVLKISMPANSNREQNRIRCNQSLCNDFNEIRLIVDLYTTETLKLLMILFAS